jgi:hypothetical protein
MLMPIRIIIQIWIGSNMEIWIPVWIGIKNNAHPQHYNFCNLVSRMQELCKKVLVRSSVFDIPNRHSV